MVKKSVLPFLGLMIAGTANAALTRLEILANGPFAEGRTFGDVGQYVRVTGRFHGELDPLLPANKGIVDLGKAPKNAHGLVEYSADFDILMPADRAKGNGTLIYDVNNRGNKRLVHLLNNVPANNALDKAE